MLSSLSSVLDICRIIPFLSNLRRILECTEALYKSINEGTLSGRTLVVVKECSSENKTAFI